jgi:arylsulfatase/arylsulfatase A
LAQLILSKLPPDKLAKEIDDLARIAAMITNIDQNVGKLFDKLTELGVIENTLVIFLVDNGPNRLRYVGPRRGMKSDVHDGGVRSPLWLHWPARLQAGRACEQLAAHIDVTPTILEACGVQPPADLQFDGQSLLPLLEGRDVTWPDRTLVIQSHRGDVPVRYHHFMIRDQRWKLLHASGFGREQFTGEPAFELYDIQADPLESKNLVAEQPEVLQRLKQAYDKWFDDVSSTRLDNYAPPRIWIGTQHENPTVLTRQDWREGTWEKQSLGVWELYVAVDRPYNIRAEFDPQAEPCEAILEVAGVSGSVPVVANAKSVEFLMVTLPVGETQLRVRLTSGGKDRGVYQVVVQ